MFVYLIQETVDLGSNTIAACWSKEDADAASDFMNDRWRLQFPSQNAPYWVQEIEVI